MNRLQKKLSYIIIVIWQSSTGEIYLTAPNTEPKKICSSLDEYIIL